MNTTRTGVKRPDRLAPQIRSILSEEILRRTRDPILRNTVVTDVQVTSDCRIATVFVVPMDEDTDRVALAAAFHRSAGYLRTVVGSTLSIRHTPELRFKVDEGVYHGRRIEALLAEVQKGAVGPEGEPAASAVDDEEGRD